MVSLRRLLCLLLTAATVAVGAFVAVNFGGGVAGVSALTPTPTPTATYTPLPTPGPTIFSVDAIPGGPINTSRSVPVGANFSVDVLLDGYDGPPWTAYQILLEYGDIPLDATGLPANWANAPVLNVTSGNVMSFPDGASCSPPPAEIATNSIIGDNDDASPALVSMGCGDSVLGGTTSATGVLVQLVFLCEAPGTSVLSFFLPVDPPGNVIVDGLFNFHLPEAQDATITCVDGPFASFSIDASPGGLVDPARTVTVGDSFSVDVVLDSYVGPPWDKYQAVIDYGDVTLDGIGTGMNLLPYPPPVCLPPSFVFCIQEFCSSPGPTAEDDVDSATWSKGCDGNDVFPPATPPTGPIVRFTFSCEAAGIAAISLHGIADTFIEDRDGTRHNDAQNDAVINCVDAPTPTPVPSASIQKMPLGNTNNVIPGVLPLANLFLCDDTDGDGPICSGPNEGELVFVEHAFAPSPLGAFEFQIKFDHKIFDINVECVTAQDPGPACTGDADEDNTLNTDADTWDIQLSQQLKGDALREWGMDKCFRNVTENYINFACVSTGPEGAGLSGDIDLAEVTLHPDADLKFRLRPGNDNGVVRVILDENCELADTLGHPVDGSIAGGLTPVCGDLAVTVRILEGDMDLDCDVDLGDAQAIAQRYGMVLGLFLYDPWYDLEPNISDFDIDAKDVQKVFGRLGSTCQDPVPPQPPIALPQS